MTMLYKNDIFEHLRRISGVFKPHAVLIEDRSDTNFFSNHEGTLRWQ
jgi:hypothetical protein